MIVCGDGYGGFMGEHDRNAVSNEDGPTTILDKHVDVVLKCDCAGR